MGKASEREAELRALPAGIVDLAGLPADLADLLAADRSRRHPATLGTWIDGLPRAARRSPALARWLRSLHPLLDAQAPTGPSPSDDAPPRNRSALLAWLSRHQLDFLASTPVREVSSFQAPTTIDRRVAHLIEHEDLVDLVVGDFPYASWPGVGTACRDTALRCLAVEADRVRHGMRWWADLQDGRDVPTLPLGLRSLWDELLAMRDELQELAPPRHPPPRAEVAVNETAGTVAVSLGPGWRALTVPVDDPWELLEHADELVALEVVDVLLVCMTRPGAVADLLRTHLGNPRWHRALDALDGLVTGTTSEDEDKRTLLWRVVLHHGGHVGIEPLRGKPTKAGGWNTRKVPLSDIAVEARGDGADGRVFDLLSGWRAPPVGAVLMALEALVGHGRVLPPGRSGHPVPVRRVSASLRLASEDDELRLLVRAGARTYTLDDFLDDARHRHDAGRMAWVDAEGITIARVPEAMLAFARTWSARRTRLPVEALPEVLRRVPAWSQKVPLELDGPLAGVVVEGDPRPLVRLEGTPGNVRVAVRLQPLPDAPPVVPGEGAEALYGVRGGRVVHVRRELGAEAVEVAQAIASLELPPQARLEAWDWTLDDPQAIAALVVSLREADATLRAVWAGDLPQVRRAVVASDLSLRVRPQRDWFGLQGEAKVDGVALDLDALLDAAADNARFVRLRDGSWARLEAGLAKALAPTAAAVSTGGITPVHAPLIAELVAGGVGLEAPADWMSTTRRLDEARTLEAPVPPALQAELRPYQLAGFRWLASLAHWAPGACLADDMGLGKTIQALALLLHRAVEGPALVIAPTSLLPGWAREAARFAPTLRVTVHHGTGRPAHLDALGPGEVLITSFGIAVADRELLATRDWSTMVVDEAHALKNPEAQRAQAVRSLSAGFRLALTGTPLENHVGELWSLMHLLAPGLLGNRASFQQRFQQPIEGQGDTRARRGLARLVAPFVLRRTKAAVAPELPARTELVVPVVMSAEERALYDQGRREALLRVAQAEGGQARMQVLAELQRLRQLACHPALLDPGSPVRSSKLAQLLRVLDELREEGHRALVFSSFTRHLDLVQEALEARDVTLVRLDGSTSPAGRQEAIDAFQAGQVEVFLLSLKAGGVGLNLTAATYVVHLDPWWNPAAEDQASDRAHRIGQTRQVTVIRLVSTGTIEEQILALHDEKRELATAVLEGSDKADRLDEKTLRALLAGDPQDDERARAGAVPDVFEGEVVAAPPPVAPGSSLAWIDHLRAAFRERLEREHARGAIRSAATLRNYTRAVDNFLAWAPADALVTGDKVLAHAARYLAAVEAEEVPHRSDKVFGRPALGRLATLVNELASVSHRPPAP